MNQDIIMYGMTFEIDFDTGRRLYGETQIDEALHRESQETAEFLSSIGIPAFGNQGFLYVSQPLTEDQISALENHLIDSIARFEVPLYLVPELPLTLMETYKRYYPDTLELASEVLSR